MDDGGLDIRAFEKLANTIGAVLGLAEDERLVPGACVSTWTSSARLRP